MLLFQRRGFALGLITQSTFTGICEVLGCGRGGEGGHTDVHLCRPFPSWAHSPSVWPMCGSDSVICSPSAPLAWLSVCLVRCGVFTAFFRPQLFLQFLDHLFQVFPCFSLTQQICTQLFSVSLCMLEFHLQVFNLELITNLHLITNQSINQSQWYKQMVSNTVLHIELSDHLISL